MADEKALALTHWESYEGLLKISKGLEGHGCALSLDICCIFYLYIFVYIGLVASDAHLYWRSDLVLYYCGWAKIENVVGGQCGSPKKCIHKGRGALNPSFSGRERTPCPGKLFVVVKLLGFVLHVDIYILTIWHKGKNKLFWWSNWNVFLGMYFGVRWKEPRLKNFDNTTM